MPFAFGARTGTTDSSRYASNGWFVGGSWISPAWQNRWMRDACSRTACSSASGSVDGRPSASSQSKNVNASGAVNSDIRSSVKVVPTARFSWYPGGGRKFSSIRLRDSGLSIRPPRSPGSRQRPEDIEEQPLADAPPQVELACSRSPVPQFQVAAVRQARATLL